MQAYPIKSHGRKGFTLAEILIATGFITMVILYCFLIMTQAFQLIRSSEDDLAAIYLANKQMEFFNSGFARVPPVGGPYDFDNVPEGFNRINLIPTTIIKKQKFFVTVTVKEVPGYSPDKFRHVIVQVAREKGPNNTVSPRKVTIESYVADYTE